MAEQKTTGQMQATLGLTGLTSNAMALIAPGAFLWLTFAIQANTGSTAPSMWAGIFAASTVGMSVLMALESVKVFLLLTTVVSIGGTVAGTFLSAFWFVRVLRRFGLRVRFAQP